MKNGYEYLGVIKVDEIKEQEIKGIFARKYKRRLKFVLESKVNGENKINGINTWAVSLPRYRV